MLYSLGVAVLITILSFQYEYISGTHIFNRIDPYKPYLILSGIGLVMIYIWLKIQKKVLD